MSFENKVVIVTGAAQGIGQEVAFKFAQEKAKVAIFDLVEPKKTINQIEKINGIVKWYEVDVSNEEVVQKSVDNIIAEWDKIDILVNNAGIFPLEHFTGISIKLVRKIFDVNVIGTFICTQIVTKQFIAKGIKGTIINIASSTGLRVEKYHSHYGASKAAVISLTRAWALELGNYGIRVNAIAPGAIMTRGAKTAPIFRESGDIPKDFLEEQKQKKPLLERMGKPEDIADMVLYLASEKGNYITGAVISVDGGRTLL